MNIAGHFEAEEATYRIIRWASGMLVISGVPIPGEVSEQVFHDIRDSLLSFFKTFGAAAEDRGIEMAVELIEKTAVDPAFVSAIRSALEDWTLRRRYCDGHGAGNPSVADVPEYPRAAPLRAAVKLIGETKK